MFRVPTNPTAPTFDDTFKVGFLHWLTSKAPQRQEWRRRRDAAAGAARVGQDARIEQFTERKITEQQQRRHR
jgi:hypothetical protein